MRVVTIDLMRKLDDLTINGLGVPALDLMEKAGKYVAAVSEDILNEIGGTKVTVICGRGNNGGDGWVAGRHLSQKGFEVDFKLLGKKADLKGNAKANLERVIELNLPIEELSDVPDLSSAHLIIDAMLGTGFSGSPEGLLARVIEAVNAALLPIVSVDMPSGVNGDTGEVPSVAIEADSTVTFAYPKIGQLLFPGRDYVGKLIVGDIGIPPDLINEESELDIRINDSVELMEHVPFRPGYGHKGTFGKGIIVAGSVGFTGAAALTGEAFLRSGAGYAILGIPKSLNDIMEVKLTEVITHPLPEVNKKRVLSLRGLGEILKLLEDAECLILGPGLSTHHETKELVKRLVTKVKVPFTLDADALNCLAEISKKEDEKIWEKINADFVMTPHLGELSRLLDVTIPDIEKNWLIECRNWARKFNGILIIKGAPTVIVSGDSPIYLNLTGNDGMATAGSGDVLSGLIGGFLAQGIEPINAARLGVYMHGLAGDLAAEEIGKHSLIASDLIEFLPEAFHIFFESYLDVI
ncbi:NAD(P)H-hydrate dehydratase [bacterium]|nr:NAD(P)H-hydrate dehydratase [bacterium]